MKWNGRVDVSLMRKAIIVAVAMLIAFLTTSFSFGGVARAERDDDGSDSVRTETATDTHEAHTHGAIVPGTRTPVNVQTDAERAAGAYERATRLLDEHASTRSSLDERLERIEALLERTSDPSDEIDLVSIQRTRNAAQRSLLPQYQRQAAAIEILIRDLNRLEKGRIGNRIEAGDYDDVPGIRALWDRFKDRRGTAALKTAVQELLDRTMTRVEELQTAVTANDSKTESASCSREEENSELQATVARLAETVEDLEEKLDEKVQQLVAPIVQTVTQMNRRAEIQQLAQTPQGQQQLAQLAQQLLADPAVQTTQNPQALAQFQQFVAGLRERLEEKKEIENPTRGDQREIARLETQIAQAETHFADVQDKVMTQQAIRDVLNVVQPQVAATSAVPTLSNAVRFGMGINPQQAQQQTTGVNGVAPASATTQAPTQTTTQTQGTQFQNLGNLFNGLSGTRHPGQRIS